MVRRLGLGIFGVLVALLLLIQLVPYGRNHTNPPATGEPAWDSPRTRELAVRACFDCHSNATAWPWYTNVAPASWLIQRDVDEGRAKLNFTNWSGQKQESREAAEQVQKGEMPPKIYLPLHPSANLSASEKAELIAGLQKTFGSGRGR